MDDATLAELRGEIINRTINIETIMSSIISQHYFGKVVRSFFIDVLYNEAFSWRLKCNILERIIKNPNKQRLNELRRLGGIRNRFAHYGIQMSEDLANMPKDASFGILDHRRGELGVDFAELHREFMSLTEGVERYLAQVYQDIGGVLYTADELARLKRLEKHVNHVAESGASMAISNSQKNQIYNHLQNVGVHSICPACNQEVTWKQATIVTVLGVTEEATPDHSRGIPLVPLVCKNCGYVRFFSAKSVGLFNDL